MNPSAALGKRGFLSNRSLDLFDPGEQSPDKSRRRLIVPPAFETNVLQPSVRSFIYARRAPPDFSPGRSEEKKRGRRIPKPDRKAFQSFSAWLSPDPHLPSRSRIRCRPQRRKFYPGTFRGHRGTGWRSACIDILSPERRTRSSCRSRRKCSQSLSISLEDSAGSSP